VRAPNWDALRAPRLGVLLHFDDSRSDAGALDWLLRHPDCHVSYNWLILRTGELHQIAPADARAWHAGVCRPSSPLLRYADANSAFYGIAIAAAADEPATAKQIGMVCTLVRRLFSEHGWHVTDDWRITGHEDEAWPRGRKTDPTGRDPRHPVLDTVAIRAAVAT
jgi:N-acetyl-anhydromuramyl-L-alanine amidase AmpD